MVHKSLIILVVLLNNIVTLCSGKTDAEILVKFKETLEHADALSDWSASLNHPPPCSSDGKHWVGVLCANGNVFGLKLENMGLKGTINVDALSELTSLKTISFMFNEFDGPLPILKKLTSVKTMYLSNNKFSGPIPSNAFEEISASLKKLHLANNKLSGPIPLSLATMNRITELTLENNEFEGPIPNFTQPRWTIFNLSNNKLEGQIPSTLASLDKSSFSGNEKLCGAPLQECEAPANNSSGLPVVTIVVIAVVIALAIIIITIIIIILQRRKKEHQDQDTSSSKEVVVASTDRLDKMERGLPEEQSSVVQRTPDRSSRGKKSDPSVKVTFLKDDRVIFDMTDLLKASAEILGSGAFGSTYKATMTDGGVTVVVKRYRQMNNVGREDFHEHMRRLGRLNHDNLLPLVAFYYKKDEKLLITDHIRNGSLAAHLHGKKSGGHSSLDWPARLSIVKGIAKGLAYLYNELPSLVAPHGHLKSSNVLLDSSLQPILADYGLIPILTPKHAQKNMIVYKSPEYKTTTTITNKSDVWSFGTLILEILTGKYPDLVDLTSWVESIIRETQTTDVLDKEMTKTKGSEGEIIKLFKIGLTCCEVDVDKRFEMKEVVEKIEEIKERDNMDDDFYSVYTSEGDMRSSRGLSDDFNFAEQRG